jgi:1-acyl-sn-glycerol-3-phosphate acyltransferase
VASGGEVGNAAVVVLSAFKFLLVAIQTIVLAPVAVGVALVDQRAAYRVCQLWVRINLLIYGVRVRTTRLAALNPFAAYVFMSNHRSQFDILATVRALEEFQLRWVAKVELTRIPVFGWAIKHTGHIIIDRSDRTQAIATLRAAREKMGEGVSVIIFPEGTRGAIEGPLLPFKKGGFMLARETGFPIVPIAVRGSGELLPRGSWQPVAGEIEVVVGPPIPVEGADRDDLVERVRAFMVEQLGTRAPTAGPSAAATI